MHRRSGPPVRIEYYAQVELLPDEGLFSASQIASRKFDRTTQPKEWSKMADALRKFASRNQMFDQPDNCQTDHKGNQVLKNGQIQLNPGDRSRRWCGSVWKSNLFDEDRKAIREFLGSTRSSEEQGTTSKNSESRIRRFYLGLDIQSLMKLALATTIVVAGFWSWVGVIDESQQPLEKPERRAAKFTGHVGEISISSEHHNPFSLFARAYQPPYRQKLKKPTWRLDELVWAEGVFPEGIPYPAVFLVNFSPEPGS